MQRLRGVGATATIYDTTCATKEDIERSNPSLLPCLLTVCTGAEARYSNFQSYILVSEVLSGKLVALHFICRNGGKFLLQPWPSQLVIVNAEHHELRVKITKGD